MKPGIRRVGVFAALCSVVLHGALLIWMLRPESLPRAVRPHRTIDVVLLQQVAANGRETVPMHSPPLAPLPHGPSGARQAAAEGPLPSQPDRTVLAEAAAPPNAREHIMPPSSGQFAPDRYAALQQRSFDAQRRAVLAASVATGLSNVSAALQPLLKTRIDCTRQVDGTLRCTPEPEDVVRPALGQLASLASEGQRLGVLTTPVHIDLGGEREVTIRLAP